MHRSIMWAAPSAWHHTLRMGVVWLARLKNKSTENLSGYYSETPSWPIVTTIYKPGRRHVQMVTSTSRCPPSPEPTNKAGTADTLTSCQQLFSRHQCSIPIMQSKLLPWNSHHSKIISWWQSWIYISGLLESKSYLNSDLHGLLLHCFTAIPASSSAVIQLHPLLETRQWQRSKFNDGCRQNVEGNVPQHCMPFHYQMLSHIIQRERRDRR